MDSDARPALRRLVHALRHGSDVSALMLRVLDEAEQAAARIDWSGGEAPDGTTDRPRVTDIDAPQLSPSPAGATLGLPTFIDDPLARRTTFWQYPLALDEERWPSPHTAADDGSGVVTRVVDGTGVLTLDTGFGGGGASLGALALLGILIYHATLWEAERQRLAQTTVAVQAEALVLAMDAHVRDVARRKGISRQCLHAWSDYIHDVKDEEGRRGDDNFEDWELEDLADQFLQERPRCRGR